MSMDCTDAIIVVVEKQLCRSTCNIAMRGVTIPNKGSGITNKLYIQGYS
jgi:hypothetical protein